MISCKAITIHECQQAAKILSEAWQGDFSHWIPRETTDLMTIESCEEIWKRILANTEMKSMGVFRTDELVGTLVYGPPRELKDFECEIYSMIVRREYRGTGMGKRLFLMAMEAIRSQGLTKVYLNCISENASALSFYQSLGGQDLSQKVERKSYSEVRLQWDFS